MEFILSLIASLEIRQWHSSQILLAEAVTNISPDSERGNKAPASCWKNVDITLKERMEWSMEFSHHPSILENTTCHKE